MKTKNILMIGMLIAVGMFDVKVRSQEGYAAFAAILGAAKTFGNYLVGETTVTPTYGLYTYDYHDNYTDEDTDEVHIERDKVRCDIITGLYFFNHFARIGTNAPTIQTTPFSVPGTALWNYNCNSGFYYPESLQQTFTVWIKITVATTGTYPPGPPYDVTLKSIGTKLPNTCEDTNYGYTRTFSKQMGLSATGATITTLGHPNWNITFPMDCYAGYFYSHK